MDFNFKLNPKLLWSGDVAELYSWAEAETEIEYELQIFHLPYKIIKDNEECIRMEIF